MELTKTQAFWQLTRMDRPIGTLLLLWPTLWALFIAAGGFPDPQILLVFIAGVVFMRAAGCVINDFADRKVDGHVKRTKNRPLPSGLVSTKEALLLFSVLILVSFALVLTLDWFTVSLSVVGLLLASIYPFMKRYTHMPQLVLGMAFGWAIPMAYAAQSGELPFIAWLLFVANVVWTVAYDTLYAMVDRDDDLKIGVKSSAILFGRNDKAIVGLLQLSFIAMMAVVGMLSSLTWPYYASLAIASVLLIRQQIVIRDRERDACFWAFLNNNQVGMVIFIGIAASLLG
ncbi:4-hydroxybenzoate octaprenyltransferase [Veronia nyctiphanis]|uniref:4-hydroxybenzoate octaprenyltransferase n=1 Tax=Veronia nyctiphanis TaxID=1278244 RepID=A0A4Q0YR12_9GAMM|nr:4-hydroxybenzoate octaprenyltransferase [Veronia nyctiphanis]RXJ73035.1 4-hydroxybenzoate octaprenyltransferase [Veronia nyctiphanis]